MGTMQRAQRDPEKTRQSFIAAAFELFAEKGYPGTSMNQIAVRGGGSRANLYLHFHNKAEIVLAYMYGIEERLGRPFVGLFATQPHTAESIRAWLESVKELWLEKRTVFMAIEVAMSESEEVAGAWLDIMHSIADSIPELRGNKQLRQHFIALWMGLDRNYFFLYGRGRLENEEFVLEALTRQWLALFQPDVAG